MWSSSRIGGPLLWLCFTCDQPDIIHDHVVDGQDLHRGCGGILGQVLAVQHDDLGSNQGQDYDDTAGVLLELDDDCGELVGC